MAYLIHDPLEKRMDALIDDIRLDGFLTGPERADLLLILSEKAEHAITVMYQEGMVK